jgi:hypothetical protein
MSTHCLLHSRLTTNDTLPSALHEAIGKLPVRFDAIVADEGQDFTELWWVTLQALLKDPEQGIFTSFRQ